MTRRDGTRNSIGFGSPSSPRIASRSSPRIAVGAAAVAALLLAAMPAAGQETAEPPASVSLSVVPDALPAGAAEPTVGDPLWATVRAFGPRGTYLLPASVTAAYAARPEVAVLGSERRDGQLRLRLAIFRTGDVVLPPVDARVATSTGDTIVVPMLSDTFHIASVLAPGDTLLADIKPLWPEPGIPLWVWAALAMLAAALVIALWWWWRRRRARSGGAAGADAGDPYEEARRRIDALAADPTTAGERIAAAAGIGNAIRGYLADGWNAPARERTSFEILHALPIPLARGRPALGAILNEVDLAKFARLAPALGAVPSLAARALGWLDGAEAARTPPTAVAEAAGPVEDSEGEAVS
jgi:hypothetical protein